MTLPATVINAAEALVQVAREVETGMAGEEAETLALDRLENALTRARRELADRTRRELRERGALDAYGLPVVDGRTVVRVEMRGGAGEPESMTGLDEESFPYVTWDPECGWRRACGGTPLTEDEGRALDLMMGLA